MTGPTVDFQLVLDHRELGAILAGLRLLRWSAGARLPYHVGRMIDDISSDGGAFAPLSETEIGELARRMNV